MEKLKVSNKRLRFTLEERKAIEDVFCSCIGAGLELDDIAQSARDKNWKVLIKHLN
jgi:hypothetical protein